MTSWYKLVIRQISEKALRQSANVHLYFINVEKAFDRVTREYIQGVFKRED